LPALWCQGAVGLVIFCVCCHVRFCDLILSRHFTEHGTPHQSPDGVFGTDFQFVKEHWVVTQFDKTPQSS
jgi:hypothetical protein